MKFGIEIAFYLIRETLLFLSYILFCVTAIITAVIFSLIGIIWVFNVNYLFMGVGFPKNLEDLILGEHGVLRDINPGTYVINHTLHSPSLGGRIAAEFAKRDIKLIDAPYIGGR